jgi:hypothetical protein
VPIPTDAQLRRLELPRNAGAAIADHPPTGPSAQRTGRTVRGLPRWIGRLAIAILAGFGPWIVYMTATIPERVGAAHYGTAWVGFDIGLWLVIAALAVLARLRHPATGLLAAVAATLFVVDAWFDVFTSPARHGQIGTAVLFAILGELPLAVALGVAAVRVERLRAGCRHHHPGCVVPAAVA